MTAGENNFRTAKMFFRLQKQFPDGEKGLRTGENNFRTAKTIIQRVREYRRGLARWRQKEQFEKAVR